MVAKQKGTVPCGWCMTNEHATCIGYIKNYDTIWICGCPETGCGAATARYTAKFGTGEDVPTEERVGEASVPVADAPEADEGTETVLLDANLKDERTDPVQPAAKGRRTRKKTT